MKRWLTMVVILIAACSCERDAISSKRTGQLYKTWVRTQILRDGKDITPNKALMYRVEFRPDGQLLYGTQKTLGGCCNPSRFNIESESVVFTVDASDPTLFCAQSLCVSPELTAGVRWQIMTLTDDKLVLKHDKTTLTYEPVS